MKCTNPTTCFITIALGVASLASAGEFVPGRLYVTQAPQQFCQFSQLTGGDKIWEYDPQTGDVRLFLQLPEEQCTVLTGLAFTPDGQRLRASALLDSEIWEIDADGNITTALDGADGISGPWGGNNIAYDAEGNFFVHNKGTGTLMRFPADGGPGQVIGDFFDGVRYEQTAIAIGTDGAVYLAPGGDGPIIESRRYVLRFAPPAWDASIFDGDFEFNEGPVGITADRAGFVYLATTLARVYRYDVQNDNHRTLLAVVPGLGKWIAISPNQTHVYFATTSISSADLAFGVYSINVASGMVKLTVNFSDVPSFGTGLASVPVVGIPGDVDLDGDVDLFDFGVFDACYTGASAGVLPGCGLCDLNEDGKVDKVDLGRFQIAHTGG